MTSSAENRRSILEAARRNRELLLTPPENKGFFEMNLDEQIKEAEQKLSELKAKKERLKNDVNISDCWPTLGDVYIDIYGDLKSHLSLSEVCKPLDICFADVAQRQRAIRWHKIDKLWKHCATESIKLGGPAGSFVFKKAACKEGGYIQISHNLGSLPKTYEFRTIEDAQNALERIDQENLLFWFRGWEEEK